MPHFCERSVDYQHPSCTVTSGGVFSFLASDSEGTFEDTVGVGTDLLFQHVASANMRGVRTVSRLAIPLLLTFHKFKVDEDCPSKAAVSPTTLLCSDMLAWLEGEKGGRRDLMCQD